MEPQVSIIVTHLARSDLWRRTLLSMYAQYARTPFEVVVVNDAPDDPAFNEVCRDARRDGIPIRAFNTGRTAEYRNQAYAMNCAARQAAAPLLILQGAECLHVGPVIDGLAEQLSGETHRFLPVHCTRLNPEDNELLAATVSDPGWPGAQCGDMIHPKRFEYVGPHLPRYFYFCAGIRRDDYFAVGGIDEGFPGPAHDDDCFAHQVRHRGLEMRIPPADQFRVLHQYHPRPECPAYYAAIDRAVKHGQALVKLGHGLANVGREWGQLPDGAEVDLR